MLRALRTAVMMLAFISFNALAAKNIYTGWFSNKAVSGYDTVAYFTKNEPERGSARFKYEYKGVEWYFSSEEHLKMFKAAPESICLSTVDSVRGLLLIKNPELPEILISGK